MRVACPPIVAPCFYGIDMSTLGELFAPPFVRKGYDGRPDPKEMAKMAKRLGVTSLRYLSADDLPTCTGIDRRSLCTACVTAKYPTIWGKRLLDRARRALARGQTGRTYEQPNP